MSTANRVIKNTGFLYAKMGLTMFVSLYTTRLLLNALGASDFGIFNVVGGSIAMLGFLNAAMATATQRFMSYAEGEGKPEKKKSIFNISVILHLGIACILSLVLLIAGYFFFNGILTIPADRVYAAKVVYGCMIISTMFTVMTVPYDAVLNSRENMLYFAIVGVIESFLKLGVAIIVVHVLEDKLIIYGVLMAAISLLVMLIMRVYCHRRYEECAIAPKQYWDSGLMKEMTGFAGWNLLSASSGMISGYGSNIVLNNFFGPIVNAANGISNQVNGQLMVFSNNMLKAVNPVIVKSEGNQNRQKMFKTAFTACKLAVTLYAFFAIPFIVESSYILELWLKNVPPYTEVFLQLLVVQVLIEQVSLPLATSIAAVGNIRFYSIFSAVVLYAQIIFLYMFYKMGYPPEMLRIIQIAGAFLITLFNVLYCYRKCGMSISKYIVGVVFRSVSVVLITIVLIWGLKEFFPISLLRLLMICVSSAILFMSLFWCWGLSFNEKEQLKQIIKKIQRKNA